MLDFHPGAKWALPAHRADWWDWLHLPFLEHMVPNVQSSWNFVSGGIRTWEIDWIHQFLFSNCHLCRNLQTITVFGLAVLLYVNFRPRVKFYEMRGVRLFFKINLEVRLRSFTGNKLSLWDQISVVPNQVGTHCFSSKRYVCVNDHGNIRVDHSLKMN